MSPNLILVIHLCVFVFKNIFDFIWTPPTSSTISIDIIDMEGRGGKTGPGLRSTSQKSGKAKLKNLKAIGEYVIIKLKMAIILPTGQWYAPSAVIKHAWYCMVLHGVAWYQTWNLSGPSGPAVL